jgi:hypothetical protein
MQSYRPFREQSAHYFNRPHDGVPDRPVESAAAWRGDVLAGDDGWRFAFEDAQIAEIESAIRNAIATGRPIGELTREDFPLPSLEQQISAWRHELAEGRGFLLITGLPVAKWPDHHCELFFWCFGLHLGHPGAQNPAGDLLGHVRDTGAQGSDEFVRLYQTTDNIAYHCDAADIVGLLCKNTARRGGQSRIVSSVSVFNELQRLRPDSPSACSTPSCWMYATQNRETPFATFQFPRANTHRAN